MERKRKREDISAEKAKKQKTENSTTASPPSSSKNAEPEEAQSFSSLGLSAALCEACERLRWESPTPIQAQTIPIALKGSDVIGIAQTGSGKTGAFALPILNALLEKPQLYFACILVPTRELATQIKEHVEALGSIIEVRCAVLTGGVDEVQQCIMLAKTKPHIVVGTPGRIADFLEKNKMSLSSIKYFVLDEADKMLSDDFGRHLDVILSSIPKKRNTYLFSATMDTKIEKLWKASLNNPVKIQVAEKFSTVSTLRQFYLLVPFKERECYLSYLLSEFPENSFMIFVTQITNVLKLTFMLRNLGLKAMPLHGRMPQQRRIASFNKFKGKVSNILIATDVGARGLDIPAVDFVVNFDVPSPDVYIHRVGRTARAGKGGKAITFVTQYSYVPYTRVENAIQQKLPAFEVDKANVLLLKDSVTQAMQIAAGQMKELGVQEKGLAGSGTGLEEEDADMVLLKKKPGKKPKGKGKRKNVKKH